MEEISNEQKGKMGTHLLLLITQNKERTGK